MTRDLKSLFFGGGPVTASVLPLNDAMVDSLLEFLRSGSLATIRLGMSVDELLAKLGTPDDVGYPRAKNSADDSIWLYGSQGSNNLQVPLLDKRVTGIWLYMWGVHDVRSLPSLLSAANWQINGRTNIEKFTRVLDSERIGWKIHAPLTFATQTCILFKSNVHAIWAHDGHKGLEKIMLTEGSNEWSWNVAEQSGEREPPMTRVVKL
jgi:hypothetical protein